jgi:hypothetical protein
MFASPYASWKMQPKIPMNRIRFVHRVDDFIESLNLIVVIVMTIFWFVGEISS